MTTIEPTAQASYGYVNNASKKEIREDAKIFANAQKGVKKSEVRNADWGLYAAQNCLAKDLVNASADELALIMDKMNFIQAYMNNNLEVDKQIYVDKTGAKNERTKANAEMVKSAGDAASGVLTSTAETIGTIKGGRLNISA